MAGLHFGDIFIYATREEGSEGEVQVRGLLLVADCFRLHYGILSRPA